MKTVTITENTILNDKSYYAGEAVVSDGEATALDDANLITGSPVDYVPFQSIEIPVDHIAPLGITTNLTAIGASFADLAAARTAVNTLKTEVEARLDAGEGKTDAIIGGLEDAGIFATA